MNNTQVGFARLLAELTESKSDPINSSPYVTRCIGPLGSFAFEPHAHECLECGEIWAHDPELIPDYKSDVKAHTCPECFTPLGGGWRTYQGSKPANRVYPKACKGDK